MEWLMNIIHIFSRMVGRINKWSLWAALALLLLLTLISAEQEKEIGADDHR